MLIDEVAVVASKIARQGGKTQWEMFEAMPHCFALVLDTCGLEATQRFYDGLAGFCKSVAAGAEIETRGTIFEAKTCKEREVSVKELSPLADGEVMQRMIARREERREGLEGEAKLMPRL